MMSSSDNTAPGARVSISLPGHRAPGAGFEAPFDMLEACHERVERMLGLLQKLRDHVRTHGADEQGQQAARDVMRYFDLAGPLHHEDEELHVFPALLEQRDPAVVAVVIRLKQDHRDMVVQWQGVRAALERLACSPVDGDWSGFSDDESAVFDGYDALYRRHLIDEDGTVYPAARRLLGSKALAAMSEDMMERRGAKPVGT